MQHEEITDADGHTSTEDVHSDGSVDVTDAAGHTTHTEPTTNADGSTTVTLEDGETVDVHTSDDGESVVVDTKADGTTVTTTNDADGTSHEDVHAAPESSSTNDDGSETDTLADGSAITVSGAAESGTVVNADHSTTTTHADGSTATQLQPTLRDGVEHRVDRVAARCVLAAGALRLGAAAASRCCAFRTSTTLTREKLFSSGLRQRRAAVLPALRRLQLARTRCG